MNALEFIFFCDECHTNPLFEQVLCLSILGILGRCNRIVNKHFVISFVRFKTYLNKCTNLNKKISALNITFLSVQQYLLSGYTYVYGPLTS